jgi:ubiquinone biosynthesis protein UbiJ
VKKRAIVAEVAALRLTVERVTAMVSAMPDRSAVVDLASKVADLASNVAWLHERVDTVATKLGNMRGDPALDGAALKRLAFAVAQFSARLDRLEAPPPPKPRPRRKPRPAK